MNSLVKLLAEDPLIGNLIIGVVAALIFIVANRIFNNSPEHFQEH